MSKLTKLLNNPSLFFKDFFAKRFYKAEISNQVTNQDHNENDGRELVFAFHINDWKRNFISDFLVEKKIIFVPIAVSKNSSDANKWKKIIAKNQNASLLIWGINIPKIFDDLSNKRFYVEDGFIRSVGLGASHTLPFSLTIDESTPYFDSTKPSDMETMLSTYDFSSESELLLRARKIINKIVETGISKYNNTDFLDKNIYGVKKEKRILVIGQVEDDASIKYGSLKKYTNNDLVHIARMENPEAEIFYKPHPDVVAMKRKELSNPHDVSHLCKLLLDDIPLAQAFETVDHVYTITSQAGFEALMRGIKVTTVGAPFYSGWGLTDDRQKIIRRNRNLSLEQVFAVAYILYPIYFNPFHKEKISIEEAIDQLLVMRDLSNSAKKNSLNDQVLELKKDDELIHKNDAIQMILSSIKSDVQKIESLIK